MVVFGTDRLGNRDLGNWDDPGGDKNADFDDSGSPRLFRFNVFLTYHLH